MYFNNLWNNVINIVLKNCIKNKVFILVIKSRYIREAKRFQKHFHTINDVK